MNDFGIGSRTIGISWEVFYSKSFSPLAATGLPNDRKPCALSQNKSAASAKLSVPWRLFLPADVSTIPPAWPLLK